MCMCAYFNGRLLVGAGASAAASVLLLSFRCGRVSLFAMQNTAFFKLRLLDGVGAKQGTGLLGSLDFLVCCKIDVR